MTTAIVQIPVDVDVLSAANMNARNQGTTIEDAFRALMNSMAAGTVMLDVDGDDMSDDVVCHSRTEVHDYLTSIIDGAARGV